MVRRICCALVLTWFCNGQPSARGDQGIRELTSGVSVDGELVSGSSDTFHVALSAGDFLHLTIMRRGFGWAAEGKKKM